MRLANHAGRAVLLLSDHVGIDVFDASEGAFGPDAGYIFDRWEKFTSWAATAVRAPHTQITIDPTALGPPSPAPRQVIAIGLNYNEHAAESGFDRPVTLPPVFTKFVTSLSGPYTDVVLPEGGSVDWEVELVLIIGCGGRNLSEFDAWSHVAGVTVGQDVSERISQLAGPSPQFSLGKSFRGFAPTGPWLVSIDELDDPDDLELGCSIDGVMVQHGRTADLIFPVPALLSKLSRVIELLPGDIVFTGTPAGVGQGRSPQRFLREGEVLRSWIGGVGALRQRFVVGNDDA